MMNWTAAKRYGASGSPVMLIGTSVALSLSSMRVISYRWGLAVILIVMVAGMTQHFVYRSRSRD